MRGPIFIIKCDIGRKGCQSQSTAPFHRYIIQYQRSEEIHTCRCCEHCLEEMLDHPQGSTVIDYEFEDIVEPTILTDLKYMIGE